VIKNYFTYFIIATFFIITSCNKEKTASAYFTGQIANPKEKNIHLFQNSKPVKDADLTNNNSFSVKIDSINEGLFTFKHGNEIQYIYITPNDSLVMRLNTWDFDESLIFSGRGSIKNNFLMQLFIENEKQDRLFYAYYNLNEKEFIKKTDSLLQIKLLYYKQYQETNHQKSKKFDHLIQLAIYYPIYSQLEKYGTLSQKNNRKIGTSFYKFRKKINLNRKDFTDFYAYRNYVKNYFKNKAETLSKLHKNKSQSAIMLQQINQEMQKSDFKDELLQNATLTCLLDENCPYPEKKKILKSFYKNCEDNNKIAEIKHITNNMGFVKKGIKLPKLEVTDFKGNPTTIQAHNINKNMVIYFWPKERNRIIYLHKRIKYLQKKYPNILFIGIDGQLDHYNWKSYIKSNHLDKNNQFKIASKEAKKWYCNELPRAIIINKNGIIQNNFSYVTQSNFETLLKKLSNN